MAEEGQGNVNQNQNINSEGGELYIGQDIKITGGTLDGTIGVIYGKSADRLSILAQGATDRLIHIYLDEEGGLRDEGVLEGMEVGEVPTLPGFLSMIGLFQGAYVEFIGPVATNVAPSLGKYQVTYVNKEEDSAEFKSLETGEERKIVFNFEGIPREEGVEVIRLTEPPPALEGDVGSASGEAAASVAAEGGAGAPAEVSNEELADGEAPGGEAENAELELGEAFEVEQEKVVREFGSAYRLYPDDYQRTDMLTQLFQILPEKDKRNAAKLQEKRREVESMLALRNRVIKYGKAGEIRGRNFTSAETIGDLMKKPNVNMNRKIINLRKTVTLDHTEEDLKSRLEGEDLLAPGVKGEDIDPPPGPVSKGENEPTSLDFTYLEDIVQRAENLLLEREKDVSAEYLSDKPKFQNDLDRYREEVQEIYKFDGDLRNTFVLEKDEDIFRMEIPDLESRTIDAIESTIGKIKDSMDENSGALAGAAAGPVKKKTFSKIMMLLNGKVEESSDKILYTPPPTLGTVGVSTARVLTDRIGRFLQGARLRVVEPGDSIKYDNVLVFPLSALRDLGPIRSGSLVQDVSYGMNRSKTIQQLLTELNISEDPSASDILSLGLDGTLLGNVSLIDWLTQLNLFYTGPGDVASKLAGYGLNNVELNVQQSELIQEKIREYIGGLREFIRSRRRENDAALSNLRYENNNIIPEERVLALKEIIESESLLKEALDYFKSFMGELADTDIYFFSYLYLKYPDLFIAGLGQQADIVGRETIRQQSDLYLKAVRNDYQVIKNRKDSALPGKPNPCIHTKELLKCRQLEEKKKDEPEDLTKMKLLLKVIKEFKGKMKDDWLWCNKCGDHLICGHEVLQLEEFQRPEDKKQIHKNLLLKFSGGVFAGKYICKLCGQAIQDLDFDTNLEFDDEGRPMMGRSVLVDEEAIRDEMIQNMLSGPAIMKDKIKLDTKEEKQIYSVLKRLATVIGIDPPEEDFRKMIKEVKSFNSTTLSLEAYAVQLKKNPKLPAYTVYESKKFLAGCICILLLQIQTRIPGYEIKQTPTECREGFGGMPLEEGEDTRGLECILKMAMKINENKYPWNATELQSLKTLEERVEKFRTYVKDTTLKKMVNSSDVKVLLEAKRRWKAEQTGRGEGVKEEILEQISGSFRPYPFIVSVEEAAADAVIPEVASPELQATAWIRQAHAIARKSTRLNPERQISLTTCCQHQIQNPREFWDSEAVGALPKLPPKTAGMPLFRTATAEATFYTEKQEIFKATIKEEEYYKLFLKFCASGVKEGELHEIGLTNICENCGVSFEGVDENSKVAIEAQVDVNEESYNQLLSIVQIKSEVIPDPKKLLPNPANIFTRLAKLKSPFLRSENWPGILIQVQQKLLEFSAGGAIPTEQEIIESVEPLVEVLRTKQESIQTKFIAETRTSKFNMFDALVQLSEKSPHEVSESLRTSFLVPFQRLLTGMTQKSFKVLSSYKLAPETVSAIMEKGLDYHLQPISKAGKGDAEEIEEGVLKRVIKEFVDDLSVICSSILPNLRSITTLGGRRMVRYLVRAYVMGPIHKLIFNPEIANKEGEEAEAPAVINAQIAKCRQFLYEAIKKYVTMVRVPTNEEIRMKLEERAEAEKQLFINKLDKMSKDRKQVELMLKKNGMGDWAVGGKKSIQQYDPEMEEKWRQERAAAGFTDFTDYSAATADAGPLDYGQLQDAMGAEQVDGGELGDYVQGDAEFAGED